MVRKEMEGGNRQRRQRAREARERGKLPSEVGVTTGASKQRHRVRQGKEHEERLLMTWRGKQDKHIGNESRPLPRPGSRPEGGPPEELP
jgi:hypothetical protein